MFRAASFLRTSLLRPLPHTLFSGHPSSCSSVYSLDATNFSGFQTSPPALSFLSHFSSSSRRKADDADDSDDVFVLNRDPKAPPRLFVIQPKLRSEKLLEDKLSEALNLANSLEEQRDVNIDGEPEKRGPPPHLIVQNPAARKTHADTYFGRGTVDTIKCNLNAVQSEGGLDAIFVNTILSGIQQRNLERAWGKPVLDRVGLIIEIFNAHAQTKEAKLQSELAALMYRRTRLVRVRGTDGRLTFGADGEAEVVSARGRGSGGRGFTSGAGETELQLQRTRILERRNHLLSQIEEVRRTRAVQRAARRRRGGSHGQGLATVAVVGYTNAGKSTLVSALSDADLYSDDRLFATVDPRLRSVVLPSGKKVLLSDTVGFISDLPVQLVEAFHATLEEVVEADLLVHVLDSSAFNLEEQRSSVLQVLQQIGVSEEKIQNMIEVWNKIDLIQNGGEDGEVGSSREEEEDLDEDDANEINLSDADGNAELSELSVMEPLAEDDAATELSQQKKAIDHQSENSCNDSNIVEETSSGQSHDVKRMETSAITGVGLQELLYLIDEKLNTKKSCVDRSYNRKWRPSLAEGNAAAAQL
ncbi:hypothetical protein H6P81_020834 [Aristolochia fimbriata]|uniref:Hflx-type G domain-containing protein n=1 Tax=Aristolochia fimbriata TaxID=158543 RepID=A0AAV7DWL6_ARIFI|nr:hypothetical protein H6P81_020834 [Aristolochia fimbriata]